ncbi:MAG: hypothetical protein AAGG07_08120 [Planctomycetota bacterium]
MAVFWIVMIAVVVLSVPVTLLWWGIGDRWADAEHKRFARDADHAGPGSTADDAVVIKTPDAPDQSAQA